MELALNLATWGFAKNLDSFFATLRPLFIQNYRQPQAVQEKSAGEQVGRLDLQVQSIAIPFLEKITGLHFFSEEVEHVWPPKLDDFGILDPCDGTHNFLGGFPLVGVMFAVVQKRQVTFSAIYLPFETLIDTNSSFFFAARGEGAYEFRKFRNGRVMVHRFRPIRTSAQGCLEQVPIILEGQCHKVDASPFVQRVKPATRRYRTGVSSAWAFTRLAMGSSLAVPFDLLSSTDNKPSDNLPGCLLVEEAGGTVTDEQGNPWSLENCSTLIFVANRAVHEQAMAVAGSLHV